MVDGVAALSVLILIVNAGICARGPTARSCKIRYKDVAHGEIYTLNGCLKLRCQDGQFTPEEEECLWKGKCYKVGTTFMDGCDSYRCDKIRFDGGMGFASTFLGKGCRREGAWHALGSYWSEYCNTWHCKDKGKGVDPEADLDGVGCYVNGKCYAAELDNYNKFICNEIHVPGPGPNYKVVQH